MLDALRSEKVTPLKTDPPALAPPMSKPGLQNDTSVMVSVFD